MSAGKHNLLVEQGATFSESVVYKTDSGDAVDLTGFTARLMLRTSYSAAEASLSLTSENGGLTITPESGQIDILITDAQTSSLASGVYVYDLEIDNGTIVRRLIEGRATVTPEATK